MERKTGVDFLRMFLMFLVPILHLLGDGGVLANTQWMSGQYLSGWLLEAAALCAVDCFALISGYVGYTAKFRWSRVANLWLSIVFYTLGITALFALVVPGSVNGKTWFAAFFPVISSQYWFITAYVGMFFFIPLMNLALERAGKRILTEVLVAVMVVFSFLPCLFTMLLQESPFGLHRGYSLVWLAILYLLGGYLRKYDIPRTISRKKAAALFCACTLLAWLSKVGHRAGHQPGAGIPRRGHQLCLLRLPADRGQRRGPAVLLCPDGVPGPGDGQAHRPALPGGLGGVSHPCPPLGVEPGDPELRRLCRGLAGVEDAPVVLALAFGIYLICSLVDVVRIRLFQALKIPALCRKLDGLLQRLPWGDPGEGEQSR